MNAASIYSGPGKVATGGVALFPEGVNGESKIDELTETNPIANANTGNLGYTSGDTLERVGVTPFSLWGILGVVYPASVLTPAIGTRFGGANNLKSTVWAPDGRLYTIQNSFVSKHPDLHLGANKPLFGPMEITGMIEDGTEIPSPNQFIQLQTGQADPGPIYSNTGFIREPWLGTWGANLGFQGFQVEDEWVISITATYKALKVQGLTRAFELTNVVVMVKFRPVGPTHQQLLTNLAIQDAPGLLGRRIDTTTGATLTLTGQQSGKTITIPNAALVNGAFEFGGSKLGTGEFGFITGLPINAGAPGALITFSA